MKLILIFILAITPALAENNLSAQLKRAQRTFERQSTAALLPEYERYLTALATLERTLASDEDFEGAASVQAERLKMKALIASAKKAAPAKRRPRTFKKVDAVSSGSTLTWTPKNPIPPGGYRITLEPEVPEAVISEGFHTAKPGHPFRISTGETITITLPTGTHITRLTLTPGA